VVSQQRDTARCILIDQTLPYLGWTVSLEQVPDTLQKMLEQHTWELVVEIQWDKTLLKNIYSVQAFNNWEEYGIDAILLFICYE
jgi:hypothetical protein